MDALTHTHITEGGQQITHTHTHKETKAVLNRLAKITGHINSVKRMIEDGRDCSDVLIQLSAVDASIKSLSRLILKDHISTCIVDAVKNDDNKAIDELNRAIDKFMK
ncbi:MAG: metal-sensing transcriptional repressor [Candidatus Ornithomonoglobus sp.]